MKHFSRQSLYLVILLLLSISLTSEAQQYHFADENLPCVNKTFQVVAHITRDSFGETSLEASDLEAAFTALNVAFEPICMAFEICDIRIIDNFQYDITDSIEWQQEILPQYQVPKQINMYFVTTFVQDYMFNGFHVLNGVNDDTTAIFIEKTNTNAKTIGHNLGRFFGLPYTSNTVVDELANESNCDTAGDLFCDTPADPLVPMPNKNALAGYWMANLDGCRFINTAQDSNQEYYTPDVGNYMSWFPADCGCGFTADQLRMIADNYRNSTKHWY